MNDAQKQRSKAVEAFEEFGRELLSEYNARTTMSGEFVLDWVDVKSAAERAVDELALYVEEYLRCKPSPLAQPQHIEGEFEKLCKAFESKQISHNELAVRAFNLGREWERNL